MFKRQIDNYIPQCEQEVVDKKAIIGFIENNKDCLERTNLIAHMTSAAFVLNNEMNKILFVHHNIFNSWGWVGGHNDGDDDLFKVAIKEAIEETGVKSITAYSEEMISLDVIYVENHIKNGKFVGDHLHLNATYLLIADENEELVIKKDENSGVKWFDISEVMKFVTEDRIKSVYTKIFRRIKKIINETN